MKDVRLRDLLRHYRQVDDSYNVLEDGEYLRLLQCHLKGLPDKEIIFFVNRKRFRLFNTLMATRLQGEVSRILNVACGPFAFENYVKLAPGTRVEAFDIDPNLNGLFADLQKRGFVSGLSFSENSAETFDTNKQFDLVLINDLFYHKAVSFHKLIDKYLGYVRPGGYVYFDLLDQRSRWLWALLGKDERFVRYDLAAVSQKLQEAGFEILGVTPSLGIGGYTDFLFRAVTYRAFRTVNNYIFHARKTAQ